MATLFQWLPHLLTLVGMAVTYLLVNARQTTRFDMKIDQLGDDVTELKRDVKEVRAQMHQHDIQAARIEEKVETLESKIEEREKRTAAYRHW